MTIHINSIAQEEQLALNQSLRTGENAGYQETVQCVETSEGAKTVEETVDPSDVVIPKERVVNPNGLTSEEEAAINEALNGSKPGEKTSGKTEQMEKSGDYDDALEDFEKIPLSGKKDIDTKWGKGKTGTLANGKNVTVRPGSSAGPPTLQIPEGASRQIEIRYI